MYVHLVAQTLLKVPLFAERSWAWELWAALRRGSPKVLAACLMPEHLHQIEETTDPRAAVRRLAARLAAFARGAGYQKMWSPLPQARVIPDRKHLARQVRYLHLNPCRRRPKLVDDPLCYPWSTHRGVVGAELDPWVSSDSLAGALGRDLRSFAEWFHRYVSVDSDVSVAGTPFPAYAPSTTIAKVPLESVIAAANAATPLAHQSDLRRRLSVLLAWDQGWRDPNLVAAALSITPRAVRRLALRHDAELLRVGRLTLGDARLRFVP